MTGRSKRTSTRRPYPGGGFTLIELIAVIIIVAVMSGVAVSSLSSITSSRQGAAATQLLRDLTFARQQAIATTRRTWVAFNLAKNEYAIEIEDADTPGYSSVAAFIDPGTGHDFIITLNQGESLGASLGSASFDGSDRVGFDWLGRPLSSGETALLADGTATITGGFTLTVHVETGHITLATP